MVATPPVNNTINNCTCYKCGQLGHLSWDFKQPKANVRHLKQEDTWKTHGRTRMKKRTEKKTVRSKKLLSSQVEEKTLTASSSQPSPPIDLDPDAPDRNCQPVGPRSLP
ncbi:hypothetical protein DSO57_1000281 [Entomophthora muscae]|uniref:Uncharacterized protein n=1 Tax=Entomophthora muscae TaxID=34485 RepID=A0ACC2SYF4_9FUNG|nr:hypothetical protein DSO57_1000281 [Entomophthora muscae]